MSTVNINAAPNDAVAMGAARRFRHGVFGRDRSKPDNIDAAATRVFGIGLGPGEDRRPNRDEGCGGNDECLLHVASPERNLALITCVERSHCHEHNGSRGNQHL